MRLFRRSLMCLVVGVTAFGVAGWAFRPRASWTTVLGKNIRVSAVADTLAFDSSFPYWLFSSEAEGQADVDFVVGVDGPTGAILNKIPQPSRREYRRTVLDDGRVFIRSTEYGSNSSSSETRVEVFKLGATDPVVFRKASGEWESSSGGRRFWKATIISRGWLVEVADAEGGNFFGSKEFESDTYVMHGAAMTDDGVFALFIRSDRADSLLEGIEVWDLKRGVRIQRVVFPTDAEVPVTAVVSPLRFDPSRSTTSFSWTSAGTAAKPSARVVMEIETGAVKFTTGVLSNPVPGGALLAVPTAQYIAGGLVAGIATSADSLATWWCIERNGEALVPWRLTPNSLETVAWSRASTASQSKSAQAIILPSGDELIIQNLEAPLASQIPEAMRPLLPEAWRDQTPRTSTHWLDWRRNDWRELGCDSNAVALTIRADAVLTLTKSITDEILLQSWPLPPRDPKWPALGVAVLASAGTWWGCARYRRRMMPATNAQATT